MVFGEEMDFESLSQRNNTMNKNENIINNKNFDFCPNRREESESNKWRFYEEDVLPLWIADMDCICAPEIMKALHQRIDHGVFGYGRAKPELYQVICDHMESKYQWKIQPEWIKFTAGVVIGFNQIIDALAKPGDSVLIQTPAYPPILNAASNRKIACCQVPLSCSSTKFEIDFDKFEESILPGTKFFLFCNPQNPSGRVFSRPELERIAAICLKHNLIIISDEIHKDILFDDHKHIPIASISEEIAKRTVTLSAASKTYNIAGLKCSYAIIPDPNLRDAFDIGGEGLVDSVNVLGLTATEAAYRYGDTWLKETIAYLESNRDYLFQQLEDFDGIQSIKPEGTFLAWLDCRGMNINQNPSEFFLKNAKVALNDGASFGKSYESYVRLNFGCSRNTLKLALERMKSALENYQEV